jgi:hypothetical protein
MHVARSDGEFAADPLTTIPMQHPRRSRQQDPPPEWDFVVGRQWGQPCRGDRICLWFGQRIVLVQALRLANSQFSQGGQVKSEGIRRPQLRRDCPPTGKTDIRSPLNVRRAGSAPWCSDYSVAETRPTAKEYSGTIQSKVAKKPENQNRLGISSSASRRIRRGGVRASDLLHNRPVKNNQLAIPPINVTAQNNTIPTPIANDARSPLNS